MSRLVNVGPVVADDALQLVLDKIDGEEAVAGALGGHGLQRILEVLQRTNTPSAALDLVAHADGGVLQLGDWSVAGNQDAYDLARVCKATLEAMPVERIRLLGCNTALTRDGQDAIKALAGIFSSAVWGSRVPLFADDFDARGLVSESLLNPHWDLPDIDDSTTDAAMQTQWFARFRTFPGESSATISGRLRRETLDRALRDRLNTPARLRWAVRVQTPVQFAACFAQVEPMLARAPGLLAVPEGEVLVPVEASGGVARFHRMTLLLDGALARVYPRDIEGGVVMLTRPQFKVVFGDGATLPL